MFILMCHSGIRFIRLQIQRSVYCWFEVFPWDLLVLKKKKTCPLTCISLIYRSVLQKLQSTVCLSHSASDFSNNTSMASPQSSDRNSPQDTVQEMEQIVYCSSGLQTQTFFWSHDCFFVWLCFVTLSLSFSPTPGWLSTCTSVFLFSSPSD